MNMTVLCGLSDFITSALRSPLVKTDYFVAIQGRLPIPVFQDIFHGEKVEFLQFVVEHILFEYFTTGLSFRQQNKITKYEPSAPLLIGCDSQLKKKVIYTTDTHLSDLIAASCQSNRSYDIKRSFIQLVSLTMIHCLC